MKNAKPAGFAGGLFCFRLATRSLIPRLSGEGWPLHRNATFQILNQGYPRALFLDSYCAQAGPSEGAS
jgi:hypothetical protein